MKSSIKIGNIIGIPIRIHFTFIFILGLFAWAFSLETIYFLGFPIGFGGLSISTIAQILLGIIAAVLLFICVLLHELGHSYVTQKLGYKINSITLFIFGGISNSEEIPRNPKQEMKIAIAGPAVSILLGIIFYISFLIIEQIQGSLITNIIYITTGSLAFYNFVLAGFNLIPAFPIDGGRVLRATFALKMDYKKATKTAATIGKGVAVAMAVFGIFYNIWLVLIAIFIFFGASQEERTLSISLALEGKKVKDVMRTDFENVSPDTKIQEVYNYIQKNKHLGFPVVKEGKPVGMISLDDIRKTNEDEWDKIEVKDVMNKDFSTISSNEDVYSIFKKMLKGNIQRFIVKDADRVVGIISRNDILKDIQISGVKTN